VPLNFKLIHKEYLAESPGCYKDSKLIFKVTGEKHKINRIAEAIKKAISEENAKR